MVTVGTRELLHATAGGGRTVGWPCPSVLLLPALAGRGGHRRPNWSLPPRDSAGLSPSLLVFLFIWVDFFSSPKRKKKYPYLSGGRGGGGGQGTLEALASWLFQAAVGAQRQGPHVGG